MHPAWSLGYVPDGSDALPDVLVGEFIGLVAALKRTGPPPAALRERLGVQPLWGQRMGTLSFGQRKRTCLLAALTGAPGLLVLDEPSNGLDPDGIALVLQILREQRERGAVLLSTNDDAFSGEAGGIVYVLTAGALLPQSTGTEE